MDKQLLKTNTTNAFFQHIIFQFSKGFIKTLLVCFLCIQSFTVMAQPEIEYHGNGYLETPTNNGTVYGGIGATLTGDVFSSTTLIPGVDVTLGNVPTGLTPVISVGGLNTWEEGTPPIVANWQDIAYGNGIFVAVGLGSGSGSAERLMTSTDGINWTLSDAFGANSCRAIAFGNGQFVAIPETGSFGYTSTDGINWTQFATPGVFMSEIVYADGKFVAMRRLFSPSVFTSIDGINWTPSNAPPILQSSGEIAFGNNTFVAVIQVGLNSTPPRPQVIRSVDGGLNWTEETPSSASTWRGIAFGNNTFVAISSGAPDRLMTSLDGIEWTARAVPANIFWSDVDFINGQFVAVALNGSVMTSPDGISWTLHTGLPGHEILNVEYGDGRYVGVGQFGDIMTTTTNMSEATVFFMGNATNHEASDNVSNITFNFNDSAFVSGDAASVVNATGPANSNLGVDFMDTLSLTEANAFEVSVFPNPTKQFVTIKTQETYVDIKLYNTLGQELKDAKITPLAQGEIIIDFTNVSAGLYYVQLSSKEKSQTVKLIKE